jgi:hypothetical protein
MDVGKTIYTEIQVLDKKNTICQEEGFSQESSTFICFCVKADEEYYHFETELPTNRFMPFTFDGNYGFEISWIATGISIIAKHVKRVDPVLAKANIGAEQTRMFKQGEAILNFTRNANSKPCHVEIEIRSKKLRDLARIFLIVKKIDFDEAVRNVKNLEYIQFLSYESKEPLQL